MDLPHFPPTDTGPDHAYEAAAATLGRWKSSGVLRQDGLPSLYAYAQTFRWAGRSYTRRALICGVRAVGLGRDVIGHERIWPGPKEDRLKLNRATRMQLSPILGFYHEPAGTVNEMVWSAARGAAALWGQIGDVSEELWIIDDEKIAPAVASALRDVPAFIADGHHRYTTAVHYRDELLASGHIDQNHEANFAMFALVASDDLGLLILPTHRVVRGLRQGFRVEALAKRAPEFSWRRRSVEDMDFSDADAFLRRFGPHTMAFLDADPAERVRFLHVELDPERRERLRGDAAFRTRLHATLLALSARQDAP